MQVECLYEGTAMPTGQEMNINKSRKCNLKSFCSEAGTARSQWLLPERPARSDVIGAGGVGGGRPQTGLMPTVSVCLLLTERALKRKGRRQAAL